MDLQYLYHILKQVLSLCFWNPLLTVCCLNVIDVMQDVIRLALSDVEIANIFTIFVVVVVIVLENWEDAHREDDDS